MVVLMQFGKVLENDSSFNEFCPHESIIILLELYIPKWIIQLAFFFLRHQFVGVLQNMGVVISLAVYSDTSDICYWCFIDIYQLTSFISFLFLPLPTYILQSLLLCIVFWLTKISYAMVISIFIQVCFCRVIYGYLFNLSIDLLLSVE